MSPISSEPSLADTGKPVSHDQYLTHYVGELRARGADLDSSECWRDYRAYAFGGLIMAIVGWAIVDRAPRSDAMFAAMANRAASHALGLCRE